LEHVVKKILSLIAVLSLATLTACGQSNTAVTLGDITISQTTFQESVDTLLAERKGIDVSQMQLQSGGDLNRSQLRFLIITTIFDEIAKELKLEVTTTEVTTTAQELVIQSGGEEALASNLVAAQIASTNFNRYVRAMIISDKLAAALQASGISEEEVGTRISELVTAKGKEIGITVNPRYGTWDHEAGDIIATDSANGAVTTPATE
jgi:ABC-type glycerol-3-phosphate transport system substrate-binding protein